MLVPCDFFAIAISKSNCNHRIGDGAVVVIVLVHVDSKTLVFYCLTRPVERAVGEEDCAVVGTWIVDAAVVVGIIIGAKLLIAFTSEN